MTNVRIPFLLFVLLMVVAIVGPIVALNQGIELGKQTVHPLQLSAVQDNLEIQTVESWCKGSPQRCAGNYTKIGSNAVLYVISGMGPGRQPWACPGFSIPADSRVEVVSTSDWTNPDKLERNNPGDFVGGVCFAIFAKR